MDSDTLQAFQKELTCSICMNYFIDPVTMDCGHSFCRPCLYLCWEDTEAPICCPECRQTSEKTDFRTNIVLKKLAFLARKARPCQEQRSEEQICGAHKEAKELFCEVDKDLLCGPCSESPEHVGHSHRPVDQVAEDYREKLLKKMDTLWTMTQEIQKVLSKETSKTQEVEDYLVLRKVMIKAQYEKMHQFLYEDEHLHLERLERDAEEIFQQLKDSAGQMIQQKESLREMYTELTETCHKPDVELLQALGNILERAELVQMQEPQPVHPKLTSWCIPGILDMLKVFREDNAPGQEMASHASLSGDARSMRFGDEDHYTLQESQRAEHFAAWGAQSFTSGRHYWEVDVTHSTDWVLGVCKDSWSCDISNPVDSEEAYLLFSLKMSDHYSLSTNSPMLTQYVKQPLGRVGVFLDYDNGIVSFYDVDEGSLIYSFFRSPFFSPMKSFLFLGYS